MSERIINFESTPKKRLKSFEPRAIDLTDICISRLFETF